MQPTSDGKAANCILIRQLESKSFHIVIDVGYLSKLQVDEALISTNEGLGNILGLGLDLFHHRIWFSWSEIVSVDGVADRTSNAYPDGAKYKPPRERWSFYVPWGISSCLLKRRSIDKRQGSASVTHSSQRCS
jgi:hypothetical protein